MKHLVLHLLTTATVLGMAGVPSAEAASSMFMVERYPQRSAQGWPQWIGRLENIAYVRYERPDFGAQYLPLSLIRTGGLDRLVTEVMQTPNVDTTDLPKWIGDR